MSADGRYHALVPEAGSVIGGKYRLRRPVGEGAMASVWSAVHETLGRPVAVKFIHARATQSEVLVARFMREARIAAAVQHRFVVDIFDFGKTQQGEPFMVMELLNGETLADRITRGPPIPAKQFVRMMEQCLTGLEAVHAAGIVHRDLKPENVFLNHDGDGGFPKLLDFGISRLDDSINGERADKLTREGTVLGTPWYMSPEQVRGKSDLDHRTDLYSIGVIMYEALTGLLPFDSETIGDLMVMIATEPAIEVHRLRTDLPKELSDVVAKAMTKDRSRRFQSANTMRMALRRARGALGDDQFTIVSRKAPSEPPEKLASGDLIPARHLGGSTGGSQSTGTSPSAATLAAPPSPLPSDQEPGPFEGEPSPRRFSVPLLIGAAVGAAGVALAIGLSADRVETIPATSRPASTAPVVDAGIEVELGVEDEENATLPEAPPEVEEPSEVEEPPEVEESMVEPARMRARRRTQRRRATMRRGPVEAFDDPGF